MKRYKLLIVFIAMAGLFPFAACEKYLDVVPSETITSEDVLSNIVNAEKIWAQIYDQTIGDFGLIGSGGYNGALLDACTDESMNHWESPVELQFNSGSWNQVTNALGNWTPSYQVIRQCNIFLENIDNSKIPDDKLDYYKARIPGYKADVRFLRAMRYFELFRRYGPVPLIKKSYNINDADAVNEILRSPVDSVVSFIASECDAAAAVLPDSYASTPSEVGRITKGACLSLKAEVLLYAASPLFNGNALYKDIKNPDGTQLFPQTYDKDKWKCGLKT